MVEGGAFNIREKLQDMKTGLLIESIRKDSNNGRGEGGGNRLKLPGGW